MRKLIPVCLCLLLFVPVLAGAKVSITGDGTYRYIVSDGLPNHETGAFPNRGNPHSISAQDHQYRVPLHPVKGDRAVSKRGVVGVAVNGVPFEPGTAEFWNRDRSSGLNYEAIGGSVDLGLDFANAHVQPSGMYHYHGVPKMLVGDQLTLVGYAADGFPFYAANRDMYKSSYRLKTGTRIGGPGGRYDGRFTSDYSYVEGSGDLDRCNGMMLEGKYVYILTHAFPYIPRCLYGTADVSFDRKQGEEGVHHRGRHKHPHSHHRHHRSPHRRD